MITITFNLELVAAMLMAIFVLYLFAILIGNTYVNLSPKAMGRLSVVWYMLGVLTVSFVVNDAFFIYFALFVVIIFMALSIVRIRRANKSSRKTAQLQGGNKT